MNLKYLALFLLCLVMASGCKAEMNALAASVTVPAEDVIQGTPTPTPEPTPTPTPEPPPVYEAKLTFTGDLMVHEWQFNDAYSKETGEYDFDYCFEEVLDYLSGADFTIGNLETTFAGEERGYAWYPTFNAPDSFGDALKNAGFDFLTTVNNHCNDKGESGILRTLEQLDRLGLDHTGTFASQEARDTVYIKEINNISFAFLAYTYGTNGIPVTQGKDYLVNLLDKELAIADIQRAKEQNADVIILLPHMGVEYATAPINSVKEMVYEFFEAGADVVIASHPHVLQPVEYVTIENGDESRQCFVAYSMGNFISSQRDLPRDASMILNLYFQKTGDEEAKLINVGFVPTWVKFVSLQGGYNIKVLSVYDTLKKHLNGDDIDLRQKDVSRLMNVQQESTKMILGEAVTVENMQREYLIP